MHYGIRVDNTRIQFFCFNRFNLLLYADGADLYLHNKVDEIICVIMMISAMCRESWQFEFWHVSSESLCEARNVFPRVLKKRGAEVDVKVLSFVSYFSFSLLISLISLT